MSLSSPDEPLANSMKYVGSDVIPDHWSWADMKDIDWSYFFQSVGKPVVTFGIPLITIGNPIIVDRAAAI